MSRQQLYNTVRTIGEESWLSFPVQLRRKAGVEVNVSKRDGPGVDVYLLTNQEYQNFRADLQFRYLTDWSFKNARRFVGGGELSRGTYHVVLKNPTRRYDGRDNRCRVALRVDVLT